jgi:hypothetical protein
LINSTQLARFLRSIPQSNQDSQTIRILADPDTSREMIAALEGCALLLYTLGVVDFNEATGHIRARSQTAKYALNSIAAYVEADLRIVDDWKTRGVDDSDFLRNGASFLQALERRRLHNQPEPPPSRRERVAQVLIKRNNPTTHEPELFFQYDKNAGQYQLVGGRWTPSDGDDILRTMVREIEEELPANPLVYGQDYQLNLLIADLTPPIAISPTFGALTEYHFHIYHLADLDKELILQPGDRWVPVQQVKNGAVIQDDGQTIYFNSLDIYTAIDLQLPGGLENLPISFRHPA